MEKQLNNGKELTIHELTYGRARLVIGDSGAPCYDDGW